MPIGELDQNQKLPPGRYGELTNGQGLGYLIEETRRRLGIDEPLLLPFEFNPKIQQTDAPTIVYSGPKPAPDG